MVVRYVICVFSDMIHTYIVDKNTQANTCLVSTAERRNREAKHKNSFEGQQNGLKPTVQKSE